MFDLNQYLKDKKHVVWDWNGTLLNDLQCVMGAIGTLMKQSGLEPITQQTYLDHFGFPVVDFYKKIGFEGGDEEFKSMSDEFHRHYADHFQSAKLFDRAEESLAVVKNLGLKQSILTAAYQKDIDRWVEEFKVSHYFDHIYGLGDNLAHSKVERGRELLMMSQIDPSETLLIGDTDHDLEVGQALGIEVILLENGHQCPSRLKKVHSQVLKRD